MPINGDLHLIDFRLRAVLLDLHAYTMREFNLPVVVTCLSRTKEENEAIGGYEFSAHLDGRGGDIRVKYRPATVVKAMEDYLREKWGDFLYVVVHDTGSGNHLHLNIRYRYK